MLWPIKTQPPSSNNVSAKRPVLFKERAASDSQCFAARARKTGQPDREFEANPPAEPLAKVGGSGLFRQLLESEPAFNPAHYYLSRLYAMTGHFGDAVTEFQKGTGIAGS